MTSDHTTNPEHVNTHSWAIRECLPRLNLKPSSSARGVLDGAWWPRSIDPATELAALIEELGAQRTPVRGIALTRGGWDSAPRRIRLASGRKVAVDWLRTGDVSMIRIIDTNYQRIDELALTTATDGRDPHITTTGSHDPASVFLAVKAQASPTDDNGASDHPPSEVGGRQRIVLLPHSPAEQIDLPHSRSEGSST
jgi:hypothetical protein